MGDHDKFPQISLQPRIDLRSDWPDAGDEIREISTEMEVRPEYPRRSVQRVIWGQTVRGPSRGLPKKYGRLGLKRSQERLFVDAAVLTALCIDESSSVDFRCFHLGHTIYG